MSPGSREEDSGTWEPFTELLSRVQHLKTVTFNEDGTSHVPLPFLEALKKYHPKADLHVKNWARLNDEEDHNNAAEDALARSPNLRSIQARFWNCDAVFDLRFPALKRIIALSPNLEEVSLTEGESGCCPRCVTFNQMEEEDRLAEKFAVKSVSKSLKTVISFSRIMEIAEVSDWSKFERLEIGIRSLKDLPGKGMFANLRHLSIDGEFYPRNKDMAILLQSVLEETHPLESLTVTSQSPDFLSLDAVLQIHGPTFRKLAFHEMETPSIDHPREVLSLGAIEKIGEHCPLLEDITLDLNFSPAKPSLRAVARALAAFPRLTIVRLYLPLGIAEERLQQQCNPISDKAWLERIWSIFRAEKKKTLTPGLRELHIKVGEWEREMGIGYPADWVLWEDANRKYVIARPHERDDRKDEIEVEIKPSGYRAKTIRETRKIPEDLDEMVLLGEFEKVDDEGKIGFELKQQ